MRQTLIFCPTHCTTSVTAGVSWRVHLAQQVPGKLITFSQQSLCQEASLGRISLVFLLHLCSEMFRKCQEVAARGPLSSNLSPLHNSMEQNNSTQIQVQLQPGSSSCHDCSVLRLRKNMKVIYYFSLLFFPEGELLLPQTAFRYLSLLSVQKRS